MLASTKCAKVVQLASVSAQDASGPYFGYDVSVLHLVKRSAPSGQPVLRVEVDFTRDYHRPRTAEELDHFIPAQYAQRIADDLVVSGTLPGIRGPEDLFERQVRQQYDRVKALSGGDTEYEVRHILVDSPAKAQAALDRIRAGTPFGVVAQEMSLDLASGRLGGELGWTKTTLFSPEFSAAMQALAPKGLVSAPVHTPFGWHVIEVEATRPANFPSYESVHDRIAARLRAAQAGAAASNSGSTR